MNKYLPESLATAHGIRTENKAVAGVIVILSLICQILADGAVLPDILLWAVRIGVPIGVQFAEFQPKFFGLG